MIVLLLAVVIIFNNYLLGFYRNVSLEIILL